MRHDTDRHFASAAASASAAPLSATATADSSLKDEMFFQTFPSHNKWNKRLVDNHHTKQKNRERAEDEIRASLQSAATGILNLVSPRTATAQDQQDQGLTEECKRTSSRWSSRKTRKRKVFVSKRGLLWRAGWTAIVFVMFSNVPGRFHCVEANQPPSQNGNKNNKHLPSKQVTSKATSGVVSSQASVSLRRIKKEFKEIVEMGTAYDWVNQKRIAPKRNKGAKQDEHSQKIICLGPLSTNLRHWHFSFRGPGHLYKGIYHGRIILPKDFPMSPPRVQLWTPSGRFVPRRDVCLSASAYHPESWTPRWTIFGLVNALRLHMLIPPGEIGGMESTLEAKEQYARESLTWKYKWREGEKTWVCVDHAKLLEDCILTLDGDNEEEEEKTVELMTKNGFDHADNVDQKTSLREDQRDKVEIELPYSQEFSPVAGMQLPAKRKKRRSKKKNRIRETHSTGQKEVLSTKPIYDDKRALEKHKTILAICSLLTSPLTLLVAIVFVLLYKR
mmetsp:Transcript_12081/g.22456  ORF Transcript_12081/g.22456 Transcript_12081/m.22456 type:complete len:503 (-) Transcript_12081:188-1696(-)